MPERASIYALLDAAEAVIAAAVSTDDSPLADAKFVAAMAQLKIVAQATREALVPPGPPVPPKGEWAEGMRA